MSKEQQELFSINMEKSNVSMRKLLRRQNVLRDKNESVIKLPVLKFNENTL